MGEHSVGELGIGADLVADAVSKPTWVPLPFEPQQIVGSRYVNYFFASM